MRKRRENIVRFEAELDKKLSEEFNNYLERKRLTRKEWLETKVNEDLNNEK